MSIGIRSAFINRQRKKLASEDPRCEWKGCKEDGICRAPKSRQEIKLFLWFCKKHVREYNLSWNYYAGMTSEEVENDVRRDVIWQRPSWKIGSFNSNKPDLSSNRINDPFKFFNSESPSKFTKSKYEELHTLDDVQRNALKIFELTIPISAEIIKTKYKELVKLYHPDTNHFCKKNSREISSDKIKDINEAYQILLDLLSLD
jgi:curved DNA-binding protein CbpA